MDLKPGAGVYFQSDPTKPTYVHEGINLRTHRWTWRRPILPILPDLDGDEFSMFAVYPSRKFLPPKVRSLVDFLVERLGPSRIATGFPNRNDAVPRRAHRF